MESFKGRTLVMGDIHGAYRALEQVLERCKFDPEKDRLIQLGDLCDGWSETWEVVEYFRKLKRDYPQHIFIRGNHDVWLHDWLVKGSRPYLWTTQGGQATLDSYMTPENETSHRQYSWKKHMVFMKEQQDWYIDDENRLYIHAGWYYPAGFPKGASMKVNAGSIAKECHWDRGLYETTKKAHSLRRHQENGLKHFDALDEFKEVYIGHTAQANKSINQYLNLWNTDSGAGWNGRLGVIDIDTKETWYSDMCSDLYFGENGRQ